MKHCREINENGWIYSPLVMKGFPFWEIHIKIVYSEHIL